MNTLRKYGTATYSVVVVHGGPGAGGEMAPVAHELATDYGVLEPIQTAMSVDGQVEELKMQLMQHADLPVILIGFSWGAWLGVIVAAKHPELARKVILVGSGPFDKKYAADIQEIRLNRLSEEERSEVESLIEKLQNPEITDRSTAFARFGELLSKADAYDPIANESDDPVEIRADIFEPVWAEAAEIRRSGKLLEYAKQVQCPVVAIHGNHDPHPAEGVKKPLSAALKNFRFILIEHCGHKPWIERQAKDEFYHILREELRTDMKAL
jgi:pimeloyl-ACP methyl ester carboxylesterase